ncbi:hypothetical protein NWT09_06935 [Mycolicibacterium sp. jd]|uniref:hypothetical protein n=1 Tax=unclassified Mycolicibacterium TaxID=2636767 RepID=UPI00351ABEBD
MEELQHYVWASHLLGYQHPDLTMHASQVRDWYGTEDGMDLGALQRDCLALDAAVRASQDALAVQERQLAQLSVVWHGSGGEAARDLLRRHGAASAAVAAAVRTAAEALTALREDLWKALGAKADATAAGGERAGDSRARWLAAATTVVTGAGDRATASELVDQEVKPFVAGPVATDWLTAVQQAVASVSTAYERSVAEIAAEQSPVFDIPGDLGPAWTQPPMPTCDEHGGDDAPPGPPAGTVPSAWSGPAVAAPVEAPGPAGAPASAAAPAPAAASAPAPAPAAAPVPEPPLPATASAPGSTGSGMGMGPGIPDLGGGLSGLGQQFADTLSGLLGGAGIGEPELPELDEPRLDEPEDLDEPDDPEEQDREEDAVAEDAVADEEGVVDGQAVTDVAAPVEEQCDAAAEAVEPVAAPTPVPAPPPAEPLPPAEALPPAEPVAGAQTPCEIAADEVPQVGEPAE